MQRYIWAQYLSKRVKPIRTLKTKPLYGVINLTSNMQPYVHFDSIKESYYKKRDIPYIKVFNEPEQRCVSQNEALYISDCKHPSGIPVMLEKFVWIASKLLETEEWKHINYFVRSNASTFLNLDLLENYIAALPKRRCYAGLIVNKRFVSGTCIIFSRDIIQKIASWDISGLLDIYDDVALSKIADTLRLRMRDIPMAFYDKNTETQFDSIRQALDSFPLIRIKNTKNREYYDTKLWELIREAIEAKPQV